MKKISLFVILIGISCGMLSGCGPSLVASIEDITQEKQFENWLDVYQYHSVSVPGLLPYPRVGTIAFDKLFSNTSTAVGLSKNDSFIVTAEVDFLGDCNDLLKIRNKFVKVTESAKKLINAKLYLNSLLYVNDANMVKGIRKITDSNFTKSLITSALDDYNESRTKFYEDHNEAATALNQKGVFVYRWLTNSRVEGRIVGDNVAKARAGMQEQYSGFAIVGGLRTSMLYVGNDLENGVYKTTPWYKFWKWFVDDFKVTTYVMQAECILYITEYDFEGEIKALIEASYSKLKDIPETIQKLDKIEFETTASMVSNLSNMGFFGEPTYSTQLVDWEKQNENQFMEVLKQVKGWRPFFSVQTDLRDLKNLSKQIRKRSTLK